MPSSSTLRGCKVKLREPAVTTCPDANDLAAFVAGEHAGLPTSDIEGHLGECAECRAAVLAAGRISGGGATVPSPRRERSASSTLGRGLSLGRYVILDLIGQGGMGSVYAAFDPELDRRVAIKVLDPVPGTDVADAQARLAREARTMARLAHPNVVAVHDVGSVGEELFVAMELVEGGTLGEWLRAERRPWREVLRRFAAAGRGLAAAHEAGLIHRDFKPDNVLLGRDGRPRVGDFGLARDNDVTLGPDTPAGNLQTAGLMGTPAYMSPEQLRMRPATPLSDQFSFCAALFEGLHGRRPYAGTTVSEMLASMEAGRLVEARTDGVPAAVQRALLKGLRPQPEARHASMAELVAALEVAPSGRWLIAGVLGVALVAASAALVLLRGAHAGPSCDGAARLAEVWNPQRQARVTEMLTASGRPYAKDVAASVRQSLAGHTAAWANMYHDACEASRRGEQSAELLDRRMACLDTVRGQLSGTVDLLASAPADDALLSRASSSAASIPSVAPCADRAALLAVVAPPASQAARERGRFLRQRLGEARALSTAFRLPEARGLAAALSVEATLAESPQLEADIRLLLATIDLDHHSHEAAETGFRRAADLAARAHDDALLAEAFVGLAAVHQRASKPSELKEAAAAAQPILVRAGDDPLRRARLLRSLAIASYGTNPAEAMDLARQSVGLVRGAGAPPLDLIAALDTLSGAEYFGNQLAQARAHVEETITLAAPILGRSHPRMAGWLNNLGVLAKFQGDEGARLEYYRRALALAEEGLGPDHVDVGEYAMNLGNAYGDNHRAREARPLIERGLAIRRRQLGPAHPQVAQALGNLSNLELIDHHPEKARDLAGEAIAIAERDGTHKEILGQGFAYRGSALLELRESSSGIADLERGLGILEEAVGPDHPLTGDAVISLGMAWVRLNQPAKAVPYLRRGLALGEKDGKPNYILDSALVGLGEVALATGEHAQAISHAERALAIRQRRAVDTVAIAEAQWLTARGLRAAGLDEGRVRDLAESAVKGYGEASPKAAEIRAWLHRH